MNTTLKLTLLILFMVIAVDIERISNAVIGVSETTTDINKSGLDIKTNNITETITIIKYNTKYDLISKEPSTTKQIISVIKNEYHIKTTEELINDIQIFTDDPVMLSDIRSILSYKPDSAVLSNISFIRTMDKEHIHAACGDASAIGCWDASIKTIYVADKSQYGGVCNTFGSAFTHEVGHVKYETMYEMQDYSNMSYIDRPPEIFADEYQRERSEDKCQSGKYFTLLEKMGDIEAKIYASESILSQYDQYICVEPEPTTSENCGQMSDGKTFCTVFRQSRPIVVNPPKDCGIPAELYSGYKKEYDEYTGEITEYNQLVATYNAYLDKSY